MWDFSFRFRKSTSLKRTREASLVISCKKAKQSHSENQSPTSNHQVIRICENFCTPISCKSKNAICVSV